MTKRQIRFPQYCESIDPTSSVYVLLKVIKNSLQDTVKEGKKQDPGMYCVYPWNLFLDGHGLVSDNLIWSSSPQYLYHIPHQTSKSNHTVHKNLLNLLLACKRKKRILPSWIHYFLGKMLPTHFWSHFPKTLWHQELKWDHSFGNMHITGCLITSMCPKSITLWFPLCLPYLQNPKKEVVACGALLKRTNFKPPTQWWWGLF
jgi:hypothetical protein